MKKILLMTLAATILAGCNKDNVQEPTLPTLGSEVHLRAGTITRATLDDTWEINDLIGVFAYNGTTATTTNAQYKITDVTTGAMVAADDVDKIYLPDGGSLNYYAYYPHNSAQSGTTYNIDVTDQRDVAKLDLMWASKSDQTRDVALQFSHQLTKLIFNIQADGVEVTDLTGLTATLGGANAVADFDLTTGALSNAEVQNITLSVTAGTTTRVATITALVVPTADLAKCKIIFSVGGKNFVWNPATTAWVAGERNTYDITLGKNYVELNGLYWATGNLISNGRGGCMIGAPTDGGLYFRFGSLVGFSGGATGDGIGAAASIALKAIAYPSNYTGENGNVDKWTDGEATGITHYPPFWDGWNTNPATTGTVTEKVTDNTPIGVGDPCRYYLKGNWRLPTKAEAETLFGFTDLILWKEVPDNNNNLSWVLGLKYSNSGTELFFQPTGFLRANLGTTNSPTDSAYCWLSSPNSETAGGAFGCNSVTLGAAYHSNRTSGMVVRCVREK